MAVYSNLAGGGTQALSPGTTHLFVDVTIFGEGFSSGRAVPTNYYHLGLLRITFHGASYPVIPIDAANQIIELPEAYDGFGWSLAPETLITVTEFVF